MNKQLLDQLRSKAYMMSTPAHNDDGWIKPDEFELHLAKLIIDECCKRMEYTVPDRIVPRPTWQLYEHFGLDWQPDWVVDEHGLWVNKK